MISKTPLELMTEASATSSFNVTDILKDSTMGLVRELYSNVAEIKQDMPYVANMVPVVANEGKFFIELEELEIFARKNDHPITEALDLVLSVNEISSEDVTIIVPSKEVMTEAVDRAFTERDKRNDSKFLRECTYTIDCINTLSENGIYLAKNNKD